ncbi:MAG: UvrB/UvrC motif-containing protein, partial [Chitinophagales bacterium]|nr:UvrB/UvrC motif-containing protein [Chitinophagales bacterium]
EERNYKEQVDKMNFAAEAEGEYLTNEQLEKKITQLKKAMQRASQQMDFMEAARLRDEMFKWQEKLNS